MAMHDVIVLGAGADVLVVDRADKPGGRCATRTFDGQPADYGPLFVHGSDPGFLAAVDAVPGERLDGWPGRVSGRGMPCQPDAFAPFQTRLAFVDGVNSLPRMLATGLAIRLGAHADSVGADGDAIDVALSGGEHLRARHLVLAMALEQSAPFVKMLGQADAIRSARGVLSMFASIPCLTVIAGYAPTVPSPAWDVCYPEEEPALLLMSNESSKRSRASARIMVFQASPRWSAERMARPKEEWGRELLDVAAHRLGPWAGAPLWTHPHRWRYSRLDRANELAGPLELKIGASRVGIIGDLFSPGGGLQAAWRSGDRLGERLVERPMADAIEG
jgi:hypothetical protein